MFISSCATLKKSNPEVIGDALLMWFMEKGGMLESKQWIFVQSKERSWPYIKRLANGYMLTSVKIKYLRYRCASVVKAVS